MPDASSLPSHSHGLDLTGRWTPRLVGDALEEFATTLADRPAHTFVDYLADRSGPRRSYTFAEWNVWTRAIAHRLSQLAGRGDRVAILAPQGPEYVAAFHACLRAGVIAVPLFQPDLPGHGERVELVFDDCRPTVVVTTHDKGDEVNKLIAAHGRTAEVSVLFPEDVEGERGTTAAAAFTPPTDLALEDVAYLQYSSGSTRAPAGTELSHLNLHVNVAQIAQATGMAQFLPDVTTSGWLPLFHDMGLLLGAASTAVAGNHAVLMDPIAFLLKPSRWIEEAAAQPHTLTAAPNFAYGLAVKKCKPELLERLELGNIEAMVNGAEPVSVETVERFEAHFGPYGLKPTAQRPSYGLAEATLFVSTGEPADPRVIVTADVLALQEDRLVEAAGDARSIRLISSGRPAGQLVVIVDPEGRPLPEGSVGEIWVNGLNVGRGYRNHPEESEAAFGGRLSTDDAQRLAVPEGPWLRTGDLGAFFGRDLYVTGRQKDLIIVDGRNLYPQDLEYTVQNAHDAIALHRLAAFPITTEAGEAVVVVAEQHKEAADVAGLLDEIATAARQRVSEEHSVSLHDFVLIGTGTIPFTSSGKIARNATRKAYLDGSLARVSPE